MAPFADRDEDHGVLGVVGNIDRRGNFQPAVVVCRSGGLRRVCRAADVNADWLATDPPASTKADRCAWRAGPGSQLQPRLGVQYLELRTGRGVALVADQVQRQCSRRRSLWDVYRPGPPEVAPLVGLQAGRVDGAPD